MENRVITVVSHFFAARRRRRFIFVAPCLCANVCMCLCVCWLYVYLAADAACQLQTCCKLLRCVFDVHQIELCFYIKALYV